MNAGTAIILVLMAYWLGYRFYAYFIGNILGLDDKNQTPAHKKYDGIDYVPTKSNILFGHHYASIAGLSPMLGPAVAVIWGWFPALLWIVCGSIFIGCVHDFGALFLSIRHEGKSIGSVAEQVLGHRAKLLMHGIIFFLVSLGMGVFVYVVAFLFSPATRVEEQSFHYPQSVIPTIALMLIAMVMAVLNKRFNVGWFKLSACGFIFVLIAIAFSISDRGQGFRIFTDANVALSIGSYSLILLIYAFLASVLPIWLLLQPRDYLNSLLLYLGLFLVLIGIIYDSPTFSAPALRSAPIGAPPLFPFMFIIIACGSVSGFHALVGSGTTAKQLDKESDARLIGYGGMLGESLLGVIAVLATTAGAMSSSQWLQRYETWDSIQGLSPQVSGFIDGACYFLVKLGLDRKIGAGLMSVIVVSFALTSLDSATRLLRYNVEEVAESFKINLLNNRYVSSAIAVLSIAFFAFFRVDGQPAGLMLWALFGTTNQILAGLTLLVLGCYLLKASKPAWPVMLAMVFLLVVTIGSMLINLWEYFINGQTVLLLVGLLLLGMAVWLLALAGIFFERRYRFSAYLKTMMGS